MEEKVLRISVGGNLIGVVGLEDIFSEARIKQKWSDVELERFLLDEVKKKNFIPSRAEGEYAKALLREYKKFIGEKAEEDLSVLQVRVLGLGCVNCRKLEQETIGALAELNLTADFDKVQDMKEIARYGVRGIPALVINGQVRCVGRLPVREQIKKWLKEGVDREKS
jgi:small redox-active disulfide protein 2